MLKLQSKPNQKNNFLDVLILSVRSLPLATIQTHCRIQFNLKLSKEHQRKIIKELFAVSNTVDFFCLYHILFRKSRCRSRKFNQEAKPERHTYKTYYSFFVTDSRENNKPFPITFTSLTTSGTMRRLQRFIWTGEFYKSLCQTFLFLLIPIDSLN